MVEVLYLSYDGMTDPLGQSQVIPYLKGLSKHGFHFHLVSFEKKENFQKEHKYISELLHESGITWHPLSYTKKPPVISTMRDLGKMKKLSADIILKHRVAIIHCRSYISGLAGLSLSKKTGAKFLFDMRGFYADERVDGNLWNLSNPMYNAIYKFFKKKEKEMLRAADGVISLTSNAKLTIDSWNFRQQKQLPIQVIPCCADLEHFQPSAVNKETAERIRTKANLIDSTPVISYLGAIGTWYLLEDMLDFFKLFLIKYPAAIFFFITHDHPEKIISMASRKGIPQASLRFYAARRNEVPAALSLSQASIFFIKPVFSKSASSPTKQGEIMGMGIPLLCNRGIGDTDYVVDKYGSGITVDLGKGTPELQNAVDRFEELISIPPEKIIAGAIDFFSLETGVKKYMEVYRHLLK